MDARALHQQLIQEEEVRAESTVPRDGDLQCILGAGSSDGFDLLVLSRLVFHFLFRFRSYCPLIDMINELFFYRICH